LKVASSAFHNVLLRAKKVGHQISVSFEKFDVVQALLLYCHFFFDTTPADSLKIYFFQRQV
jgi:predicted glycosyltransferase